jgi:hypothetical protein
MEHPAFTILTTALHNPTNPCLRISRSAPARHFPSVRAPHKPPALTLLHFISQPSCLTMPYLIDHDPLTTCMRISSTRHPRPDPRPPQRESLSLHPEDSHMPSLNAGLASGSPRFLEWRSADSRWAFGVVHAKLGRRPSGDHCAALITRRINVWLSLETRRWIVSLVGWQIARTLPALWCLVGRVLVGL